MRYFLILNNEEPNEGELEPEMVKSFQAAFARYAEALSEADVLVAAEILQPTSASTTVTCRSGATQVQDGPFADTKEKLAGVFVLDVADLDAALAWAEKCPGVQYGVIEVRPSAVHFADGQWQQSV
jgi:hypothetical protein